MSKKTTLLLAIVCLIVYNSTGTASDLRYKSGELIIRFAPKAEGKHRTLAEQNELLASIDGGTVKNSYKIVPGLTVVKLPQGKTVKDALPAFKNVSGILYAEPDYEIKLLSTFPNDPRFNELWGMYNTGQTGGTPDADIDAPEAWDTATDSDIIIAVIDSGVDYNHPDLSANMWINPGEDHPPLGIVGPEDFDGVNDDGNYDSEGNPLIDDIYGYNFGSDDADPMDYYGHGTHVAGTIGGVGNNGEGVAGVCWHVKMMALNIDTYPFSWEAWTSNAIEAIEYAVDNGAKVLNGSWRIDDYSQSMKDVIDAADSNGVLFVAAAGNPDILEDPNNDSSPRYPASYDCNNIIAVMATDHSDVRSIWYFSSSAYGAISVDLAAPGSDILSCVPYYIYGYYYDSKSGTSMAAPHVAGACALVWSMNRTLSHLQVKDIILNSVDQKEALNGLCVTGGRLNLYNAVANTPRPSLDKVDNVDDGSSVLPYNEITYTIYYANPPVGDPLYVGTLTDVNIVDYLPDEVEPINPLDPNYNPCAHTYTWNIGTLEPNESGSVTLTVTVNDLAEPLGTITNKAVMTSSIGKVMATEITDVNSWNPPVIYVDGGAYGSNTGMSWHNAYKNLQKALARARAGCGSQIWVAAGTYKPTTEPNSSATFQLINGVPIYGGFPSGGGELNGSTSSPSLKSRDWMTNETILDGQNAVENVITANGIEDAILDGFTIRGSYQGAGIYLEDANVAIANCKFIDNLMNGISCCDQSKLVITNSAFDGDFITSFAISATSSAIELANCTIKNHIGNGIYVYDSNIEINRSLIERSSDAGLYCYYNSMLNLTNSVIRFNGHGSSSHGIYLEETLAATIKNNWIHNNGKNGSGDGIFIHNLEVTPTSSAIIRNNTIVSNAHYGIQYIQSGWPSPPEPNISNCIIWGNTTDQLSNCSASYSWTTDPCFFNPNDSNNLHLDPNSPCIDRGNPNDDYNGETDIDGGNRVFDGDSNGTSIIDIGADEFYWIVNFADFAVFANAWDPNSRDTDFDPDCDLDTDGIIDYNDLAIFCDDWLTQAVWAKRFTCCDGGDIMQTIGQSMSRTTTSAFATTIGTAASSISAEQQLEKVEPIEIEQVDIEAILDWLDEVWLDPEVQKAIPEDEWLKFIESVASELQ